MAETPETTMTPEGVPEELAAILERAIYAMPRIELTRTIARVALAAVLPAHEAMVRARVAKEIRDYAGVPDREWTPVVWSALRNAARVAEAGKP